MSTAKSRLLSGSDNHAKWAVRIDPTAYVGLSGLLVVDVTTVTYGAPGVSTGILNMYVANDPTQILKSNAALSSSGGTLTATARMVIAINNGMPSAVALQNADGTWDAIHTTVDFTSSLTSNADFTVNYTLTFIDLTTAAGGSDQTITLNVTNTQLLQEGSIKLASSTFAGQYGYVLMLLKSARNEVNDNPTGAPVYEFDKSPLFTIWQGQNKAAQYALPKVTGTKNYSGQRYVFAVNNGVCDLSTYIDGTYVVFAKPIMEKIPAWPCNDNVTLTLTYACAFTAAP